jgi:hypothetical protein
MYLNYGESFECCGYAIYVYAPRALTSSSPFILGSGFAFGAIEIDASNQIYVGDATDSAVLVAQLPNPTTYRSIPTVGEAGYYLTLDAQRHYLYTVAHNSSVGIYNYVSGAFLGSIFGLEEPSGLAVFPTAF